MFWGSILLMSSYGLAFCKSHFMERNVSKKNTNYLAGFELDCSYYHTYGCSVIKLAEFQINHTTIQISTITDLPFR